MYKFLLAGLLILPLTPAFGGTISLVLDTSAVFGVPGTELTYTGTLTAHVPGPPGTFLFLNGYCDSIINPCDGSMATDTFLSFDDSVFFGSVPGAFIDGDIISSPVFGVVIASNAPTGVINDTFFLLGGDTPGPVGFGGSSDVLGSASFQIVVSPEPGSATFLLTGLLLAITLRKFFYATI